MMDTAYASHPCDHSGRLCGPFGYDFPASQTGQVQSLAVVRFLEGRI